MLQFGMYPISREVSRIANENYSFLVIIAPRDTSLKILLSLHDVRHSERFGRAKLSFYSDVYLHRPWHTALSTDRFS